MIRYKHLINFLLLMLRREPTIYANKDDARPGGPYTQQAFSNNVIYAELYSVYIFSTVAQQGYIVLKIRIIV